MSSSDTTVNKVLFSYRCLLQQKWNNSSTSLWIVGEFLLVIAVLSQRPDSHLVEADNGEDGSYNKKDVFEKVIKNVKDMTYQAEFGS